MPTLAGISFSETVHTTGYACITKLQSTQCYTVIKAGAVFHHTATWRGGLMIMTLSQMLHLPIIFD